MKVGNICVVLHIEALADQDVWHLKTHKASSTYGVANN